MPVHVYAAASAVGCLPNVAAYVYLGSLLDSLADIAAGRSKPPGPASWALLAVGLAATVAATLPPGADEPRVESPPASPPKRLLPPL